MTLGGPWPTRPRRTTRRSPPRCRCSTPTNTAFTTATSGIAGTSPPPAARPLGADGGHRSGGGVAGVGQRGAPGHVRTGTASGNQNSSATLDLPPDALKPGADNVVSVLVRNMGDNEDGGKNDAHKAPRGLLSAALVGSDAPVSWRIQGVRGGETLADPVRGPQNNGGLFGERAGLDAARIRRLALGGRLTAASRGRRRVCRGTATRVKLGSAARPGRARRSALRRRSRAPLRVLIFVDGWNVGQYVDDVGPQHVFVLPQGILRHQGTTRSRWRCGPTTPPVPGSGRSTSWRSATPPTSLARARPLQPGLSSTPGSSSATRARRGR